ncbi:hypothetical protein CMI37_35575 [Candidatus Pacearchaeota archaeon]|nr:hypothetical protein [Candidatus Pacearchaeota archaeon]
MVPMASSEDEAKVAQKPNTVKEPKVRDDWVSEEFKQMKSPGRRYKKKNDIYDIDEIENTCKDLAIDG